MEHKKAVISTEVGDFIFVKGGTFNMGDEHGDLDDYCRPLHQVTISDFYIGKTQVTQKQWKVVMGENPSYFKNMDNHPVESVSWNDVQEFIKKLNKKTGKTFRLPTEAEWEYAAKGGLKSKPYKYSGSDKINEVAWCFGNSKEQTYPVAQKKPNELGIYDMSGNVSEWCQDKWHDDYISAPTDDSSWERGDNEFKVYRGGSWVYAYEQCRVAMRSYGFPYRRYSYYGFRLIFVP